MSGVYGFAHKPLRSGLPFRKRGTGPAGGFAEGAEVAEMAGLAREDCAGNTGGAKAAIAATATTQSLAGALMSFSLDDAEGV